MKKAQSIFIIFLIITTVLLGSKTAINSLSSPGQTIYIEPQKYIFDINNATIGTKFNVTVWVSSDSYPWNLMMFQVYIIFNHQYINVTTSNGNIRAWPNQNLGGRNWDSEYVFYGQGGGAIGSPVYYYLDDSHGAIMLGDLLAGETSVPSPKKLACFEFEVKALPAEGETLSCTLNIDNSDTYLFDSQGPISDVTKQDGYYEISSPAPPPPPPPPVGTQIAVEPEEIIDPTMVPSSIFDINITILNVTEMITCEFNLTYDPNVIQWIGIQAFKVYGQTPTMTINSNGEAGYIWTKLVYQDPISTYTLTPLVNLVFHVKNYGASVLDLHDTILLNVTGQPIEHEAKDGFFMSLIRDVAITDIFLSRTWAYKGWPINITLTVLNLGNINETFNVTAYYDETPIETVEIVDLPPNVPKNITITWDTSTVDSGTYTIKGEASTVPYEIDTTNNILTGDEVLILALKHDIAITSISTDRTWVYQGQEVNINVTVKNIGDTSETFNITVYYNESILFEEQIIELAPNIEITLSIVWNTSTVEPHNNYTLWAETSIIPYEYNMTNNRYINGIIEVRILGDVDGDGKVNMVDMWLVQGAFGASPGHPRWNPYADIDGSQRIDMIDIYIVQKEFGSQ